MPQVVACHTDVFRGERHVRRARIANRRAHFHGQRRGKQFAALQHQRMNAREQRGALLLRSRGPAFERVARSLHRPLDIARVAKRNVAERVFRVRAYDRDAIRTFRRDPLAVDKEPIEPSRLQEVTKR
jgi:hypothetical protein